MDRDVCFLPLGVPVHDETLCSPPPARPCCPVCLLPLALLRVPPAGPEGWLFRGDGFGDEYGGGRSWGGGCREDHESGEGAEGVRSVGEERRHSL